jgi:hypothetical protein
VARKITDAERIVGYFQTNAGTPAADTIYEVVRGIYRREAAQVKAAPARKPRRKRQPKVTFVQAEDPGE